MGEKKARVPHAQVNIHWARFRTALNQKWNAKTKS